ncbi:MAG TPA: dienelactone hydrolase family protein [Sphingobium sp.]
MAIERQVRVYEAPGGTYESVAVYDPAAGEQPGLLLFPNFLGTKEWDFEKAETIAALGFKVLVVDYYGQGKRGTDMESGGALMQELTADRALMRDKLKAHHAELFKLPDVKPGRVAAVGFCLGGKCVLDLARSGADIAGVVNHGVYDAPSFPNAQMVAKLLICHGWNDPLCSPEATVGLAKELTDANLDWQLISYSKTGHGFTANGMPLNEDESFGYQPNTDRRSWQAMVNFFEETF